MSTVFINGKFLTFFRGCFVCEGSSKTAVVKEAWEQVRG